LRYIVYCLLAVVFSFLLHEFTHWITGEILGYKMEMTLNKVFPLKGSYDKNWHYTLISATGPLVTLLQTLTVFLLIKRTSNSNLYPFLFTSFYLELLSGVMNFSSPNDLGRISRTFNLGLFTIPIAFILCHLILTYKISIKEKYSGKFILKTLLLVILFSSIWILANQKFNIAIIK
jgi:hypothetical protein